MNPIFEPKSNKLNINSPEKKENEILISDNTNNNIILNSFIIEFNYNGQIIKVQGNLNKKMSDIINKFIIKTQIDKDSIYFLYNGNIINKDLFLSEIVNREDKNRNKINILVYSFLDNQNSQINSIIKSKEIICPKCLEEINIKIHDYKISLYGCKNGHKINDMNFKDFQKKQNIDLKKIICNECNQTNKFNSYNNQFYKCFTCNKNLCPLCKIQHNNNHQIIDYGQHNSMCKLHFESYNSYCNNCKKIYVLNAKGNILIMKKYIMEIFCRILSKLNLSQMN